MKSLTSYKLFTSSCSVLTFISFIVILQSCGTTKYNFNTSSVVPAAEGSVKVKKDKNENFKIDLNIIRLAEPNRLNPAKDRYILWMETEQNERKLLGQLKTSSGLLSKTLKSSLSTVTAFKPKNFFITAENDANVQYPGEVILTTGSY